MGQREKLRYWEVWMVKVKKGSNHQDFELTYTN
jgi:hypothetical protein